MNWIGAMRPLLSLLSFGLALLLLGGSARAAEPLLAPAQLQALLKAGSARVVDVREPDAYALQHVPGAVSAPYGQWRGPAENPGALLPLPRLTALVRQLGLTPETHAVIVYTGVDSTDFGSAARVYWTLKSLGMRELSILNGGLAAWKAAGFPVSKEPRTAPRSQWQPSFNPEWLATRSQVQQQLGQPGGTLIDARPAAFFEGRKAHDNARARGTLPGAVSLDSDLFFEPGSAALMDRASLAGEAQSLAPPQGGQKVAFCNTGHWAATDWFVLSEVLGQPQVKLYPGSMVDWTQAPTPLPMEHEPGRLAQLRYLVLHWANRNLGTPAP